MRLDDDEFRTIKSANERAKTSEDCTLTIFWRGHKLEKILVNQEMHLPVVRKNIDTQVENALHLDPSK